MKVREFLTPLTKPSLIKLSKNRALKHGGTTSDLLERLARSYKGDFESLLRDLRRQDLYEIGRVIEEQLHYPTVGDSCALEILGISSLPNS